MGTEYLLLDIPNDGLVEVFPCILRAYTGSDGSQDGGKVARRYLYLFPLLYVAIYSIRYFTSVRLQSYSHSR